MNYNQLNPRFRKGSVLFRKEIIADEAMIPSSSIANPAAAAPPEEAGEGNSSEEVAATPAAPATQAIVTEEASSEASPAPASEQTLPNKPKAKKKGRQQQPLTRIEIAHCDIIKDEFWDAHAGILEE
ncbi:hypothetical protein BDN70DRAFT_341046 [Pholiota conissans]|uniref:Uncharacterized protein n=1 Tax=Pholiota conissans TaxID=109636 RepID=A0A9P6D4K4_9AGAR|nr:hypothetical protein BDN70DRAFT_341046 [Pholiota conissans]